MEVRAQETASGGVCRTRRCGHLIARLVLFHHHYILRRRCRRYYSLFFYHQDWVSGDPQTQMHSLIPLSLLLAVLDTVNAVILPFEVRTGNPPSSLHRRTPVPISNTGNAQYVANITLGGETIPVLLDTGR